MKNVSAIILAAGIGSRMKSDITKQNISLLGKTVLQRTLEAFCASELVTDIVLVVRNEEIDCITAAVSDITSKPIRLVSGGKSRAESAKNGFLSIAPNTDFVAIHDCARCLITPNMIDAVISVAFDTGAATAACSVSDTVKTVDEKGLIISTIPRETVYRAQTPQVFNVDLYRRALLAYEGKTENVTDDNMLVEAIGADIRCVDLGPYNIKITSPEDIAFSEFILRQRGE